MANLGKKNGIYHVRFRFAGKEYKKTLKTRIEAEAVAAGHLIELVLHRLHTGQIAIPAGVDAGDFVVSGGTLTAPKAAQRSIETPQAESLRKLSEAYSTSQRFLLAPSYLSSQEMHLRHLMRHLGRKADLPCDEIGFQDLDAYLQTRLAERHPNTVERERITLLQFFKWLVKQKHLSTSPAVGLTPVRGGEDLPRFHTALEIEEIIARGGVSDEERLDLWNCLFLSPIEITKLLACVRQRAQTDFAYLLHAIPAYTGMRRGEVIRLKWVDVDLEGETVTARSRKQSRQKRETARRIPLHTELKSEILKWRAARPRGQFVICEPNGAGPISPDRANRVFWQPMRRTEWSLDNRRDLFKVGFHTYRHSFASNLAAAGVDQRLIDRFMGHTTEAMRERYQHLFPSSTRSAIASFSLAESLEPTDNRPGSEERKREDPAA